MNNRYFICKTHKKYTDAGYRWAYWKLEDTDVATLGGVVDVNAVLAAQDYWHPTKSEENEWLCSEILPAVRQFLEAHEADEIEYSDEDFLVRQWELGYEWCELGPQGKEHEEDAPSNGG